MNFVLKALLTVSFLFSVSAHADPAFSNITESEFEDISKELSANFLHHSVQGAAPLGSIFGFELGLVAGKTAVPKTNAIVQRNAGAELKDLYHASLIGVLTVPFGITGEIAVLPKTKAGDLELEKLSLAAKLSLNTELLQVLPFNMAFRVFTSSSKFNFKQTSNGVNGTVEDKNDSTGFQLLASPSLPFVEPYVGIGYITAKNSLSVTGTGSIFNNAYTSSQSSDKSVNSSQYLLGVTAQLLVASVGLEYSNAFNTGTYSAKLAFGF